MATLIGHHLDQHEITYIAIRNEMASVEAAEGQPDRALEHLDLVLNHPAAAEPDNNWRTNPY